MKIVITLFALAVLAQVSLNAAAPRPYGYQAPNPQTGSVIPTDSAAPSDPDAQQPNPKPTCGCGADCKCSSANGRSANCGCINGCQCVGSTLAPITSPTKPACGCGAKCECSANQPSKNCGCKSPCGCGKEAPSTVQSIIDHLYALINSIRSKN